MPLQILRMQSTSPQKVLPGNGVGLGDVTNSSGTRNNVLKSIQHHLQGVSDLLPSDFENHVNTAFLAPTVSFMSLSYNPFRDSSVPSLENSARNEVPVASERSDGIPGWQLKDNADLLTEPVTEVLNTSYFENCLPSPCLFYLRSLKIMSWKNTSSQLN